MKTSTNILAFATLLISLNSCNSLLCQEKIPKLIDPEVKLYCSCFEKNNYPLNYLDVDGSFELKGYIRENNSSSLKFFNEYADQDITIPHDCIHEMHLKTGSRDLALEFAFFGGIAGGIIGISSFEKNPDKIALFYVDTNSSFIIGCAVGASIGALIGTGIKVKSWTSWKRNEWQLKLKVFQDQERLASLALCF